MLATYVVSSIWHGFYVGYYMFFISAGLLTEISRIARAKISPRFKAAGPIIWKLYSIACMILNNALINYVVLPFHLLTFESTHMVYSSFGYIPQILVFAFYVIFTLVSRFITYFGVYFGVLRDGGVLTRYLYLWYSFLTRPR